MLVRKHRRLLDQANRVAEQIQEFGRTASGAVNGARRRPRNTAPLVDSLGRVLRGKTLGVAEAAEAVQKAEHKSSAKSFRNVVSIALVNSGKFQRVERGETRPNDAPLHKIGRHVECSG